jgi:hypothetical protein
MTNLHSKNKVLLRPYHVLWSSVPTSQGVVPFVHLLCFYSVVFSCKSCKFSVKGSMWWTCYVQKVDLQKNLLRAFNCTKNILVQDRNGTREYRSRRH